MNKNNSSKWGLIKKALYIWAVQYHFVIPKEILKGYVHKYHTESDNISKYGKRFYDPSKPEEYQKWLTFQTYDAPKKALDVTLIGPGPKGPAGSAYPYAGMDVLHCADIKTKYACLCTDACQMYDIFDQYLGQCDAYDLTYFDHDEIDGTGARTNPHCKPDFSYDTLRGFNYIGNCWVIRTELLQQFDGQTWDPYRWLLEYSDQHLSFGHISKILYGDKEKEKSGIDSLHAYMKAHQINAAVSLNPDGISTAMHYNLQAEPLISIIIPTKDGKDVLDVCLKSIYEKATYPSYEIIIADNGSTKEETKEYFTKIQADHDNIHIFDCCGPFNFSLINNKAIFEHAHGEYVVLLNNDTSIVTPDWLEQMLSYAQMDHVGSVGALMYYPDGTIQHGGVITGKGGGFAHRYYRKPADTKDYMYTLTVANDVAACTAACLMIPMKKYQEVHGMNEELTVQFNDVDLAIRLLEKGYFNVFLPQVKLIHYESKSRGIDKEQSAVERYVSEVDYAQSHYGRYIAHDPYYNDAFDKNYDYMLIVGNGSN